MATSINSVTVSGYLGSEPNIKEFGESIKAEVSVAVTDAIKTKAGWENKTVWVKAEFWNNQAKYLRDYGKKGSFIVVTGKLAEDVWDSNGETKRKMYLKGLSFHLPNLSGGSASLNNNLDDLPF